MIRISSKTAQKQFFLSAPLSAVHILCPKKLQKSHFRHTTLRKDIFCQYFLVDSRDGVGGAVLAFVGDVWLAAHDFPNL